MNANAVDLKMIPISKGRLESGTSGEAPVVRMGEWGKGRWGLYADKGGERKTGETHVEVKIGRTLWQWEPNRRKNADCSGQETREWWCHWSHWGESLGGKRQKGVHGSDSAQLHLKSRSQMPYDLTYEWNLINRTNKQAKSNRRHGNKEQTDSNQRERGRRITGQRKGKSHQGTCIKDPWTKPKGVRIEGGRWGGWGGGE